MFESLLKTALYLPLIVVFWQYPLYVVNANSSAPLGVSAVQRVCYEILAPAHEVRYKPPDLILGVCSSVLPSPFSVTTAKKHSSIMSFFRTVMDLVKVGERYGTAAIFTHVSLRQVAVLTEASNWIRLLPSMLIFSPHCRGALVSFLVLALATGVPCGLGGFTVWYWLCLSCALAEYVLGLRDKRRVYWQDELLGWAAHVLSAPLIGLCVVIPMAMAAQLIDN
jgi:hypothetical protein